MLLPITSSVLIIFYMILLSIVKNVSTCLIFFWFSCKNVYSKNKKMWKKGIKHFILFYNYGNFSELKINYQILSKTSRIALQNYELYTYKNPLKRKSLTLLYSFDLFPFHDKIFSKQCIKPIANSIS